MNGQYWTSTGKILEDKRFKDHILLRVLSPKPNSNDGDNDAKSSKEITNSVLIDYLCSNSIPHKNLMEVGPFLYSISRKGKLELRKWCSLFVKRKPSKS